MLKLSFVWKIIAREVRHFYQLEPNLRRLLVSYYLYLIAFPLTITFTSAYLWRSTQSLPSLIIYNVLYSVGLPIGFYLNGALLQKFHVLRLYLFGAITLGLGSVLVVFSGEMTFVKLILYGLIFGVGSGIFWGNKNYLSLLMTKTDNRFYYNSLETSGGMIINIVVPAAIGMAIVLGELLGNNGTQTAYQVLMLTGLSLLTFSGLVMQKSSIEDIVREPLLVKRATGTWQLVRLYNIFSNLVVGAELVLPSVLILHLVGNEGILGIISSLVSFLSAITLYIVGRKGNIGHVWKLVLFAYGVFLLSASGVAWQFAALSVILYSATSTVSWALSWTPAYTVLMEIMDREMKEGEGQYAFVCDNEVFFNVGRVGALLLILGLWWFGQEFALRYSLILIALFQVIGIFPLWLLGNKVLIEKHQEQQ